MTPNLGHLRAFVDYFTEPHLTFCERNLAKFEINYESGSNNKEIRHTLLANVLTTTPNIHLYGNLPNYEHNRRRISFDDEAELFLNLDWKLEKSLKQRKFFWNLSIKIANHSLQCGV